MTQGRLAGRRALITGAADGIGLGIARRFAAEGAHVVLADFDDGTARSRLGGDWIFDWATAPRAHFALTRGRGASGWAATVAGAREPGDLVLARLAFQPWNAPRAASTASRRSLRLACEMCATSSSFASCSGSVRPLSERGNLPPMYSLYVLGTPSRELEAEEVGFFVVLVNIH